MGLTAPLSPPWKRVGHGAWYQEGSGFQLAVGSSVRPPQAVCGTSGHSEAFPGSPGLEEKPAVMASEPGSDLAWRR